MSISACPSAKTPGAADFWYSTKACSCDRSNKFSWKEAVKPGFSYGKKRWLLVFYRGLSESGMDISWNIIYLINHVLCHNVVQFCHRKQRSKLPNSVAYHSKRLWKSQNAVVLWSFLCQFFLWLWLWQCLWWLFSCILIVFIIIMNVIVILIIVIVIFYFDTLLNSL